MYTMESIMGSNLTDKGLYPSLSAYRGPQNMLIDLVPENMLDVIHPYWHQFPAYNPYINYLIALVTIFQIILAYGGNLLVIYIFITTKSLRTPSNMLILNLAISDFLIVSVVPMTIVNSINQGPSFGPMGCNIYAAVTVLAGTLQALTNAAIAFDRYRTITRPFDGRLNMSKIIAILCLIWALSLFPGISPVFGVYNRYLPEGLQTTCTMDYLTDSFEVKSYTLMLFVYSYCIPVIMLIYFYSKIVMHVCQHESSLRDQAKKMNVQSLRSNDQKEAAAEIRIAKVTIGLFVLYLFSWTPYAVVVMMACFGNSIAITPLVASLPSLFVKTSSVVDPLVYALNHPKYRLELQKRISWCCISEPEPTDDNATINTTSTEAPRKD